MVSELVQYKRLDYAIRHFSHTGRRLRVVGDGPEYRNLKRLAGTSVEFCGRVSAADLRELYARSRALLVPGEEDFGITMVESLASGKPVLALGRGGAREIVLEESASQHARFKSRPRMDRDEPHGGILYTNPSAEELDDTLARFEVVERDFHPQRLQARAACFSEARFRTNLQRILSTPD